MDGLLKYILDGDKGARVLRVFWQSPSFVQVLIEHIILYSVLDWIVTGVA
jgi:hypothetical protein